MGNVKPVPEGMNTATRVIAVEGANEMQQPPPPKK